MGVPTDGSLHDNGIARRIGPCLLDTLGRCVVGYCRSVVTPRTLVWASVPLWPRADHHRLLLSEPSCFGRCAQAGENRSRCTASEVVRAVGAAMEVASGLDLAAADTRVLHNSNKLALRLLPCDVVARVAFAGLEAFQAELEIGRRLAEAESPVASLEARVEPRVYERHGFVVTFWTYYEQARQEVSPADYAKALERLHAGMAKVDVTVPHFSDRVAEAQQLVASPDRTPGLEDSERSFSAARYEARDVRSVSAPLASNSCMESHTRATCSTRRAGRCS